MPRKAPRVPDHVIIVGKRYSVTLIDHKGDVDPDGDELLRGHVDTDKQEIRLFNAVDPAELADALCHEILHGIFAECKALVALLQPDAEETFVCEMASVWVDTMRRNSLGRFIT